MSVALSSPPTAPTDAAAFHSVQAGVIQIFVRLGQQLGLPKSVGEIFGLAFISPDPLSLDDFVHRLRLSKGSASQGLRLLRSIGALRTVYVPGSRRDHYVPEMALRKLIGGFLREKLQANLEADLEQLKELGPRLQTLDPHTRAHVAERLSRLEFWHKQSLEMLPLLGKFLED